MGKEGPCCHCGVTSTPLWRNGPLDKPVLCNACGSRWRTKGTLLNYTPLHSRAEYNDYEDYKIPKVKTFNKIKEPKLLKRKQTYENVVVGRQYAPDNYQNFKRVLEEDLSNKSSSGSAISYSESCTQFGNADASSSQSNVWDTLVPSKKRTCFSQPKQSSIEKLRKDLRSILHEQQSSYFSGSSEDDLIYGSLSSSISDEIGHGSFLIKHPSSKVMEEESEASSFTLDYKLNTISEAHSYSDTLPVLIECKSVKFSSAGAGNVTKSTEQGMQDNTNNDTNTGLESLQVLRNHDSPLASINLQEVVNFEDFLGNLTDEEQKLLMNYLPSTDTAHIHDSLTSMFESPQFVKSLSSFQMLLAEGVFDLSSSEMNTDECETLKKFALDDLTNSRWVEHYNFLKDEKQKQITGEQEVTGGHGSSHLITLKRSRDGQSQKIQEPKLMLKCPKRVMVKTSDDADVVDNYTTCFSPRSLFAPPDRSSLMLGSLGFVDDNDLLFDVPSNGSFA